MPVTVDDRDACDLAGVIDGGGGGQHNSGLDRAGEELVEVGHHSLRVNEGVVSAADLAVADDVAARVDPVPEAVRASRKRAEIVHGRVVDEGPIGNPVVHRSYDQA